MKSFNTSLKSAFQKTIKLSKNKNDYFNTNRINFNKSIAYKNQALIHNCTRNFTVDKTPIIESNIKSHQQNFDIQITGFPSILNEKEVGSFLEKSQLEYKLISKIPGKKYQYIVF